MKNKIYSHSKEINQIYPYSCDFPLCYKRNFVHNEQRVKLAKKVHNGTSASYKQDFKLHYFPDQLPHEKHE